MELEKCRQCNGEPMVVGIETFRVVCGCGMQTLVRSSREEAAAIWNRKPDKLKEPVVRNVWPARTVRQQYMLAGLFAAELTIDELNIWHMFCLAQPQHVALSRADKLCEIDKERAILHGTPLDDRLLVEKRQAEQEMYRVADAWYRSIRQDEASDET